MPKHHLRSEKRADFINSTGSLIEINGGGGLPHCLSRFILRPAGCNLSVLPPSLADTSDPQ